MNKVFYCSLVALVVVASSLSCKKEVKPSSTKEYVMSIGLTGEITGVSITDLTKASGNDLYGIQVYSKSSQETSGAYQPYAHALINSLSGLTIKLLEGYQYRFVATLVVNGMVRIKHYSKGFAPPFTCYPGKYEVEISSGFNYSTDIRMDNLGKGISSIDGNLYYFPDTDRYYGELSDYIPSEGGRVTIEMKRTVYGLKVITEGLTEGSLCITCAQAPDLVIVSPLTEAESIYTFKDVHSAWEKKDYSVNQTLSFTWTKANGTVVPIATESFVFYRNKRTTITIKVEDDGINNGVGVDVDNAEMVEGESYVIKGEG